MIFGRHINRYYLKYGPLLLFGILSLLTVDYLQLLMPNLYQMVINGMNQGYIVEDGVQIAFDSQFLLHRICIPMVFIVLAALVGRFLWRYAWNPTFVTQCSTTPRT